MRRKLPRDDSVPLQGHPAPPSLGLNSQSASDVDIDVVLYNGVPRSHPLAISRGVLLEGAGIGMIHARRGLETPDKVLLCARRTPILRS